ncbi:MAG TPA: flagellar basal body protein [Acidimicrobiales bacterium]|nr:flagellar basal body protein [Acidimicrobiales bacterium]
MSDGIVGVLQFAVDSLSLQQQTTANNIANDQTPGYTAQEVSFEQSLQQAISSPTGGPATATVTSSPAVPGSNGNNVDLPTEMTQATQETMQYQTMVELLNAQFRLVQGAAGGSFQ